MSKAVTLAAFTFAWAVILVPPLLWLSAEAIGISACGIVLLVSLAYIYNLLETKR